MAWWRLYRDDIRWTGVHVGSVLALLRSLWSAEESIVPGDYLIADDDSAA